MNRPLSLQLIPLLKGTALKRGAIFGVILLGALISFEVFNFSTTQFALLDVLGELSFAGVRWASILAFAFCGIDFAGIARIFTPEQGRDEPVEVYYLFGAWLLAAAFNALLTWWGVSVAILQHQSAAGAALLTASAFNKGVPIFVAAMVWLIRVLIIGTFSVAGERLFTLAEDRPTRAPFARPVEAAQARPQPRPSPVNSVPTAVYARPAPKPFPAQTQSRPVARPEPSYHPVGMSASAYNETGPARM
ncbi:MAG: hypothetical protein HFACDABA_03207 [Anaerolineales bacterium]|nr:hypothetical protein [Anaerolineales bacterium]